MEKRFFCIDKQPFEVEIGTKAGMTGTMVAAVPCVGHLHVSAVHTALICGDQEFMSGLHSHRNLL